MLEVGLFLKDAACLRRVDLNFQGLGADKGLGRESGVDGTRRFKKGEPLFKEGEACQHLWIIKSGRVSLFLERSGRKTEILSLTTSQVMGEQALFGQSKHMFSAEAQSETKVLEVPMDLLKTQFAESPSGVKLLIKSMADEVKQARGALRSFKMENDKSPCPQPIIVRVFTLLNLVTRHTGQEIESEPGAWWVDWSVIKLYASRMFLESPARLRSLLDLLLKLGHCELEFRKNEEGEEELTKVKLKSLQLIEDFAEFYQYNFYKAGRSEVIYVDSLAHKVAKAFSQLAKDEPVDHRGAALLDYDVTLKEIKRRYKIEVKDTHLSVLSKKGLFVQTKSTPQGVRFVLDPVEFLRVVSFWDIITEIDHWNEKGFVDMKSGQVLEEEEGGADGESCSECGGAVSAEHRFCPHCGFRLESAA